MLIGLMLVLALSVPGFVAGCGQGKASEAKPGKTETVEPMATVGDSRRAPPRRAGPRRSDAAKVTLYVLTDKRCKARHCRTGGTSRKLRRILPGVRVVQRDWSHAEARKLFAREGLTHLPAYLFTESVEQHPRFDKMRRYLEPTPKGHMNKLKVRAKHDPRAEICDNQKDDTGNGKMDCADPSCKDAVVCRPEIKKRLEVFVMSQCSYGTRALDSMSEVLAAFDRKIDFRIHFIVSARGSGFKSLHGQAEVDENIRELCAIKHYPKRYKYMDYIWCRNRKIRDKNWKACTGKKTGIDAKVIETCASGEEGKALLRADMKLAKKLDIGSSPTWLANNRYVFYGIPPERIKQQYCKHNPGQKGCEKKLSSKSSIPDGTCN